MTQQIIDNQPEPAQDAIKALQVAMKSVEIYQNLAAMNAEDRRMLAVIHSQLARLYRKRMKEMGHPDFQCF